MLNVFEATDLVGSIDTLPYGAEAEASQIPTVFFFRAPISTLIDFDTCTNATTVPTQLTLLNAETLTPIKYAPRRGLGCGRDGGVGLWACTSLDEDRVADALPTPAAGPPSQQPPTAG